MERGDPLAVKRSAARGEVSGMAGKIDRWRGRGTGEGCHRVEEKYWGPILQGYGAGGKFLITLHELKGEWEIPRCFGDNAMTRYIAGHLSASNGGNEGMLHACGMNISVR